VEKKELQEKLTEIAYLYLRRHVHNWVANSGKLDTFTLKRGMQSDIDQAFNWLGLYNEELYKEVKSFIKSNVKWDDIIKRFRQELKEEEKRKEKIEEEGYFTL